MKVYSMKVRNPVVAAVLIVAAIGALALAFMVGVILLTTLAAAGALLGAGMIIRNKLGRGRRAPLDNPRSVRATLDPSMEIQPEPRALPRSESDLKGP